MTGQRFMTEQSTVYEQDRPMPSPRVASAAARPRSARPVWGKIEIARVILILVVGAMVWVLPGEAHAQSTLQELSWAHSSPETVSRFIVFASMTNGDRAGARQVNVGKPANATRVGANYVYSAVVAVDLDEFVAVAAVGYDGSVSALSAWTAVPPSTPGQPLLIP